MRGPGGRRSAKESLRPSHATDTWQQQYHYNASRDSDASFCSSRPSSVGVAGGGRSSTAIPSITDQSFKLSAVRTVNAYLASRDFKHALSLKPIPPGKSIIEIFQFLLSRLDFTCTKLEDDLPLVLKSLGYPHKLNKSALKAPGTPHSFPHLLAVMHWLAQIASYNDHLKFAENTTNRHSFLKDNSMMIYAVDSYSRFLSGDDDAVEELDREMIDRLENERSMLAKNVDSLDDEIAKLQIELVKLRSGPSQREKLVSDKGELEADVKKFEEYIASLTDGITMLEQALQDKDKELFAKVEEKRKICEENEELKKQVEMQGINMREADRMKRELQAVEREVEESETSRSAWEEKSYAVDASIRQKFKELETLAMECNQTIKRLKLGDDIHYQLNPEGSNPAEVMGFDYKLKLKPSLASIMDEVKKNSVSKLEELISLQQQAAEMDAKIEAKKSRIAVLQSHIDEVESQLNIMKKETEDYKARSAAEAKKLKEEVEGENHYLKRVEADTIEILKDAELKLQEAAQQSEAEVQKCASELFALIDVVSKHKEYMESKIADVKKDVSEAAEYITESFKKTLPVTGS